MRQENFDALSSLDSGQHELVYQGFDFDRGLPLQI